MPKDTGWRPGYDQMRDNLEPCNEAEDAAARLSSGKAQTEQRVRAVCHLAYHLRLVRPFEEDARSYEDARYKKYAAMWEGESHAR